MERVRVEEVSRREIGKRGGRTVRPVVIFHITARKNQKDIISKRKELQKVDSEVPS